MHCIAEKNEKQHFDKKTGSATHMMIIIIIIIIIIIMIIIIIIIIKLVFTFLL